MTCTGSEAPCANVVFVGCPLDSDERDSAVRDKRDRIGSDLPDDPYLVITQLLEGLPWAEKWKRAGSMEIPSWLRPLPVPEDRDYIHTANFVQFAESGDLRRCADALEQFVTTDVLPDVPCLIGVDHALSGGVIKALVNRFGSDQLAVVVLDAHSDAIPVPTQIGVIEYDLETNAESCFDARDPFLEGRSDSYNASSFLLHLLREGVICPRNLCLLGVADYPSGRAFRIKDERVRRYVEAYAALERQGVSIVTRQSLMADASAASRALDAIDAPYVYVSVDLDVGAQRALNGVRFCEREGLPRDRLLQVVEEVGRRVGGGSRRLVGLDLMEIDVRRAGWPTLDASDRTYEIALQILERLCRPGLNPETLTDGKVGRWSST
jgi:arginase family enzyme